MSSDLVKSQPSVLASAKIMNEAQFDDVFRLAKALAQSRMFKDVNQAEQAFARILLGADLGLSPTRALMNIDVVEGNARVRSTLLGTWVRQHDDYDYKILGHDTEHCVIEFFYKGEAAGQSAYTIEDAKLAGLVKTDKPRSAWMAHPRNMLWARAMSNGVKWYCPDLTGGIPVYTEADVFDSTATEIGAGEGNGSEPGWSGLSEDLVADVEALLQVAQDFGHPLDRASVQLRLNEQPEETVRSWIADTSEMLAKHAPEGGES